ncbi:MAG: hypothetical protein CM15mP86_08600 [Gammaproteobacteria bacterium]|nr:MAG: hypothetical protein CM15mP86_08600 [Gammaproteobacteria bacterium]
MLGPDISHRRTLVKSLVRNKRVREEIDNLSEGNERRKVQLTKKLIDMQMRYVPILITLYLVSWHLALLGFGIQDTKAYTQKFRENQSNI